MLYLLLACAEKPVESAMDSVPEGTQPVAQTFWYSGSSDGQTPDGSYNPDPAALWFLRALDPAASTITEKVWTEGARNWDYYELVHAVDAEAGTFTADFVTPDGTLKVEGAYDAGDAWAWTAWHSVSTYQDGQYMGNYVTSEDSLAADGSAVAHKEVFDATDAHTWSIVESLTPVEEAVFNEGISSITVNP